MISTKFDVVSETRQQSPSKRESPTRADEDGFLSALCVLGKKKGLGSSEPGPPPEPIHNQFLQLLHELRSDSTCQCCRSSYQVNQVNFRQEREKRPKLLEGVMARLVLVFGTWSSPNLIPACLS